MQNFVEYVGAIWSLLVALKVVKVFCFMLGGCVGLSSISGFFSSSSVSFKCFEDEAIRYSSLTFKRKLIQIIAECFGSVILDVFASCYIIKIFNINEHCDVLFFSFVFISLMLIFLDYYFSNAVTSITKNIVLLPKIVLCELYCIARFSYIDPSNIYGLFSFNIRRNYYSWANTEVGWLEFSMLCLFGFFSMSIYKIIHAFSKIDNFISFIRTIVLVLFMLCLIVFFLIHMLGSSMLYISF